jgi:hypothetical protein
VWDRDGREIDVPLFDDADGGVDHSAGRLHTAVAVGPVGAGKEGVDTGRLDA